MTESEQIDRLRRLCRWDNPESRAQGAELAIGYRGAEWANWGLDEISSLGERDPWQELRLLYGLAEAMQSAEPPEAGLRWAMATQPEVTFTRQLICNWRVADRSSSPQYDWCWLLLNLGLYRAGQSGDSNLFTELLKGVEVRDNHFHKGPESPLSDGFHVTLEHTIRALLGLAPESCVRATELRQSVQSLKIDATHSQYAWDQEFPVDLLPVARFENLETLEIIEGSPVLHADRLDPARLQHFEFHRCHLPWREVRPWNHSELRRALDGGNPDEEPTCWAAEYLDYLDLETGQIRSIRHSGADLNSFNNLQRPPGRTLPWPLESPCAVFLRNMMSETKVDRQKALRWACEFPNDALPVCTLVDEFFERFGPPKVQIPNSNIDYLSSEWLQVLAIVHPDVFETAERLDLSRRTYPSLPSPLADLDFLRFMPALKELKLGGLSNLQQIDGLLETPELEKLHIDYDCGRTDLSILGQCTKLIHLSLERHPSIETLTGVAGVNRLRSLDLSRNQFASLPLSPDWHFETKNLHLILHGCEALRTLEGVEHFQGLEKLLVDLSGCTSLEDIGALNQLKLRKLHLKVCRDPQWKDLLKQIHDEDTRLVITTRD